MLVVLNSILSFAKRNGLCINIKPSFHVSCITCKVFLLDFVWKVLWFLFSTSLNPWCMLKMFVLGLDRWCQRSAKEQMEPSECGVKCMLENQVWSLLSLNWEKLGGFLYPEIERATWPESPGGLWARTRWWPFDLPLPFEHWFLVLFCFVFAAKWC